MTGVTVAICCYNSATRIRPTLEHLLAQVGITPHSWEVLLVDNGSNDDTVAVAKQVWTSQEVPLRIVAEPKLGVMHARMRALREAAFEYINFLDDDNWVCPQWISEVIGIMNANSDVAALGTQSKAVFEIPPPPWFAGFQGCYAVGRQWPESGDVTDKRAFFWSAGLTVRRAAWQHIIASGFQSHLEGRRGSALTAGEDNEICQALRLAGWRLYQEPKLEFQHFIPARKLTWDYLRNIVINFGVSSILLDAYEQCYSAAPAPWHRRYSGHWLHPAVSAIKALSAHPVASARVLMGYGVGHPSAYHVYFHYGRLQSALRMRGRYNEVFLSISQCARALQRNRRNATSSSISAVNVPNMPLDTSSRQ